MKPCKRIKEFLLTDYIDGECRKDTKKEIEQHLAICSDCRSFFDHVQQTSVMPFEMMKEQNMPDEVISGVFSKIDQEKNYFSELFFWKNTFFQVMHSPAVRVAFFIFLMMVVIVFNGYRLEQAKNNERNMFLAYVQNFYDQENDQVEYGTTIELFLL